MQTQRNKVVVHYLDGQLLKGYTHDFMPDKALFHVSTAIEPGVGTVHEVNVLDLKAVFFVRAAEGNPDYKEKKRFEETDGKHLHGIKIKIVFKDGETLRGVSMGFSKTKKGFFVIPVDPHSNNERVFVLTASTSEIITGPKAEE